MTGYDPANDEEKFDCRFGLDLGGKMASIKNFSIHDTRERGQGLGARVIANLLDAMDANKALRKIKLSAELERGAFVWLKMGWLPDQTSFRKLQSKCQSKLDALQTVVPREGQLSPVVYGIFRDLLDSKTTQDPAYAWALVDSGARYRTADLKEIQGFMRDMPEPERHAEIRRRADANGVALSDDEVRKTDKTLRFISMMDLDGLAQADGVSVGTTLLAWESWKGTLDMDNKMQMERLEKRLVKVREADKGLNATASAQPLRPGELNV